MPIYTPVPTCVCLYRCLSVCRVSVCACMYLYVFVCDCMCPCACVLYVSRFIGAATLAVGGAVLKITGQNTTLWPRRTFENRSGCQTGWFRSVGGANHNLRSVQQKFIENFLVLRWCFMYNKLKKYGFNFILLHLTRPAQCTYLGRNSEAVWFFDSICCGFAYSYVTDWSKYVKSLVKYYGIRFDSSNKSKYGGDDFTLLSN